MYTKDHHLALGVRLEKNLIVVIGIIGLRVVVFS